MAPELSPPTYFILASLLDGPRHGYAIVSEADSLSEGQVRLTAGTLYGALDRLARQGLVEIDGEEVVAGRKRRYYRLTGDGQAVLEAEAARLQQAAEAVRERVAAAGPSRSARRRPATPYPTRPQAT